MFHRLCKFKSMVLETAGSHSLRDHLTTYCATSIPTCRLSKLTWLNYQPKSPS